MVQVVIKAFDILELVAQRNGMPISLTEIADELQFNQATAANIINTLVDKNYLEHIGKKKGYKLGPSAYRLTNEIAYEQDLLNAAKEEMEQLTASTNETSILGSLRNFKRYILHTVNANQDIQVQIRTERNVYETASGRLLVAYLNDKELDRFLNHNGLPDTKTWPEVHDLPNFKIELSKIRKAQLALTNFENTHIVGFAVPVFSNEKVIAGLSVFLPEYRCTAMHQQKIIELMKETALNISRRLEK
jgi:IclR family transcriptional regulator, KDG regulon repressor